MNKLLTANFIRLKKSKLFWVIVIGLVLVTCMGLVNTYDYNQELIRIHTSMAESAFEPTTALHFLYQLTPLLGLVTAFMTVLFIGTEYHDNTMRNKFICGQSRTKVYLANLLTCFLITVLFWLLPVLTTLIVGVPLLGMPDLSSAALLQLFVFGIIGLLLCAVYATICTLLSMLIHNRSYALISAAILALILLFLGSYCESRLGEPEYYSDYEFWIAEDGTQNIVPAEPIKNPLYLDGNARRFWTFCYDFFPGGQAIQIADLNVDHPHQCMLYSLFLTGAGTIAGLYFFKKKDLK